MSSTQILLIVVCVALAGGVGFMVYRKLTGGGMLVGSGDGGTVFKGLHVAYDPPGSPWARDDDMRSKLEGYLAVVYKRSEPTAYMAFGAHDYETQEPTTTDLEKAITNPLHRVFENVTIKKMENVTWMKQPAVAFEFLAAYKTGGDVIGECHAVAYKGIGYYSICWASHTDVRDQIATFEATRGKFRLLQERKDWQPKVAPPVDYRGEAAAYKVIVDDTWVAATGDQKPPEMDLLLRWPKKKARQNLTDEAQLETYVIDSKGGNPKDEARAFVEELRGKDLAGAKVAPRFTERAGPGESSEVVRLESTVAGVSGQDRLYVISGVKVGEKLVVIAGWCRLAEANRVEPMLLKIVGSLQGL